MTSAKETAEILSDQYKSVFTVEDVSSTPSKGTSPYSTMPNISYYQRYRTAPTVIESKESGRSTPNPN